MIIICEICNKFVCPPPCPGFDGRVIGLGEPLSECEMCGARLYSEAEAYPTPSGARVCSECAEELVSCELLELCECADAKEFFEMLR